jgi:DNA-damage-inducible protein J
MATMAIVQVQVDAEVASQAAAALKKQGMDVSDALGFLLARVVRDGGLVLEQGEDPEYDAWVCTKVQEALDDPRPPVSHEEMKRRWALRRTELLAQAEAVDRCA